MGMAVPGVSWGHLGDPGASGGLPVGYPPPAPPIPCNSPRGQGDGGGGGDCMRQHGEQAEQLPLMAALEVDGYRDSAAAATAVATMGAVPQVASRGEGGARGVGALPVTGDAVGEMMGDWSAAVAVAAGGAIGVGGVGDATPPLSPGSVCTLSPSRVRPSGVSSGGRRDGVGFGEGDAGAFIDDVGGVDVGVGGGGTACVGDEEGRVARGFERAVLSTTATVSSPPAPLHQRRNADDGACCAAEDAAADGGRVTGKALGVGAYFVSPPPDPDAPPVALERRDFDDAAAVASGWVQEGSPHAGEKRGLGASALTKSDLGYDAGGMMRQQELGREGGVQGGVASRPAMSVGASAAAVAAAAAMTAAGDSGNGNGNVLVASFEGLSLNPTSYENKNIS